MKITYAALVLTLFSASTYAKSPNLIADKAYKAGEYAKYIHDLSKSLGSAEQCAKLLDAWNDALVQGENNYAAQPSQSDFNKAKKMCNDQYTHLIDANKDAQKITRQP